MFQTCVSIREKSFDLESRVKRFLFNDDLRNKKSARMIFRVKNKTIVSLSTSFSDLL